ncbi:hypothetical protein ACC754_44075, partial [Rhizobium johnstonii]
MQEERRKAASGGGFDSRILKTPHIAAAFWRISTGLFAFDLLTYIGDRLLVDAGGVPALDG